MIKLAAFADEADKALEGQIAALKRNCAHLIELRGIYDKNILAVTEEEANEYAAMLRDNNIGVWSIGSPLGKVKIDEYGDEYREKVRHICRLANIFGTDKIRMFSFYEAYDKREKVFDALSDMVSIAREYGVELYHENEKKIYGDTVERVLDIRNNVKGLKFIYDPANFLEVGEDSASALDSLHSGTDYFHIKDVIAETGQIVPAGYGDGLIDRLVSSIDGDKVLTVEPHLAIFRGFSEIDGTEMKNKFTFKDNNEAFDAAMTAIKSVLTSCGYKETEEGFTK